MLSVETPLFPTERTHEEPPKRASSSDPAKGGETAIDRDDHAGDEFGRVAQQPHHGPDELCRLAESAHRCMVDDGLATGRQLPGLLVGQEEAVLFGQEESRRDRVDADVLGIILANVHGQPLREVADRRLGRRVRGNLGQRPECVHAGDVQDDAGAVFRHLLAEDLRRQQRPDEIQVEDESDRLAGQVEKG